METTNGLKATVESGETALGAIETTYSERTTELVAELGYDFVWLDLEHGGPAPSDGDALERFARAARAGGSELLVRVPEPSGALVRKVLDAGVKNVFVSRVETETQAREIARAARFETEDGPGERGMASPRASKWGLVDAYPERADRDAFVGATIETLDGVAAIEDICATGLDFVFAGPLDLAVAHGTPGEHSSDAVLDDVERIRTAAHETDTAVGNLAFGVEDAQAKRERGFDILNVANSIGAVRGGLSDTLSKL